MYSEHDASPLRGPSTPGGATQARYVPNGFQFNSRVALALIPSIVFVIGCGGNIVLGTLLVGAMITYILDALRVREGSFATIWITLILLNFGLLFSGDIFTPSRPLSYSILLYITAGEVFFLTGVWASLQFRWLQLQHPGVTLAAERFLFASCPTVAAVVTTWGIASASGPANSPFYLAALLCAFYYLFALPQGSSFAPKSSATLSGGRLVPQTLILSRLESALQAVIVVAAPGLVYLALHYPLLLAEPHHLWSMLLLASLPPLWVCFCSRHQALWWLDLPQSTVETLVLWVAGACVMCAVAGFEGRVVLYAFSRYIMVPAPWSWVLVTVALYGFALLGMAHFMGAIGPGIGLPLATGMMVSSAAAASLVAGVPLWLLPAPLVAAGALCAFYQTGKLMDYLIFIAAVGISFTWFLSHHFWFLDVAFGGVPMQMMCRVMVVCMVLVSAVPGLVAGGCPRTVLGVVVVAHAVLMGQLEDVLYTATHAQEEPLYPAYLVVATTLAGLALAHRLRQSKRIALLAAWALHCLYAAKLSIMFLPGYHVLPTCTMLSLTVSAPHVIPYGRAATKRLTPQQGSALAGAILLSLLVGRHLIADVLQVLLDRMPSDALLLGTVLLCAGAATIPLASLHFPGSPDAKRGVLVLMCLGVLLVLLAPPLPAILDPLVSARGGLAENEAMWDDAAIYGERAASHSAWPSWILLATCLTALLAATSSGPAASHSLQVAYAAMGGVGSGVYIAAEFFPADPALQVVSLAACVCTCVILVFFQQPSAASPRWIPYLYAAVLALLPVGLLTHAVEQGGSGRWSKLTVDEVAAVQETQTAFLGLFACICVLLSFAIKLKVSAAARAQGGVRRRGARPAPSKYGYSSGRMSRPGAHYTSSARWTKQVAAIGGEWMPVMGNVSVLVGMGLALVLNLRLSEGSNASILALAPLLLLLNQDVLLLQGLGDKQRYFPLAVAVALYLTVNSAAALLEMMKHGQSHLLGFSHWTFFLKNAAAILFTAPSHYIFSQFLWDGLRRSDMTLLCATPLNIPPLFLADVIGARWLAGIAIIEALVQYFVSRHIHITGLKCV